MCCVLCGETHHPATTAAAAALTVLFASVPTSANANAHALADICRPEPFHALVLNAHDHDVDTSATTQRVMKRERLTNDDSDHHRYANSSNNSSAFAATPFDPLQPQHDELFYTSSMAFPQPTVTTAAAAARTKTPMYPGLQTAPPSTTASGMDDDMDHWLVDICAQLSNGDDTMPVGVRLPDAARCYDASSPPSSEFRPVYPATAASLHMSLPAMVSVAPVTPAYVPYASSSSSPGSSSVESSSDTKHTSFSAALASAQSSARPVRRTTSSSARPKKSAVKSEARGGAALSGAGVAPDGSLTATTSAQMTPAETRREKNRLRVRRHYYRKLSQMNDLRAQVSELEDKIQSLRLQSSGNNVSDSMLLLAGADPLAQPQNQLSHLQSSLQQLKTTKQALMTENQRVRDVLYQQTRQFMLARQQEHSRSMLAASGTALGPVMPMPFIVKRRLAPSECDGIWQKTTRELGALVCHSSATTVNSQDTAICGWHATRAVEDGAFKFVFQKLLRACSAEATLDASWAIFSDPQGFAKLYSPSVHMWCSLVQTVDSNNVVLYQEHKSMDKDQVHVVMKTVLLATRIKDLSTGAFGITLRGLEHDQLELEDLSVSERDGYEVWNDINCWLQWIPRGETGDDCEIKVSGAIPTVGANAYFWMVEVLLIVMRLEAATTTATADSAPFTVS